MLNIFINSTTLFKLVIIKMCFIHYVSIFLLIYLLLTCNIKWQKIRTRIAHNTATQPAMMLPPRQIKTSCTRGTPCNSTPIQPRNQLLFMLFPFRTVIPQSEQTIQSNNQFIRFACAMIQTLPANVFEVLRVASALSRLLWGAFRQKIFLANLISEFL